MLSSTTQHTRFINKVIKGSSRGGTPTSHCIVLTWSPRTKAEWFPPPYPHLQVTEEEAGAKERSQAFNPLFLVDNQLVALFFLKIGEPFCLHSGWDIPLPLWGTGIQPGVRRRELGEGPSLQRGQIRKDHLGAPEHLDKALLVHNNNLGASACKHSEGDHLGTPPSLLC